MREETIEARETPAPGAGAAEDIWDVEQRYRQAKAVLLSAEEETVLAAASVEFASARRALRLVLEEIWPDQAGEYRH